MIKPLLRIIPQLSGNVKISSKLTDIREIDKNIFESEIRYANLQPLSSALYQKNINADLLNSTYAFDLKKYYTYYNDIFFESMFNINKKDMILVDKTTDQYFRNTDFELGTKRISNSKSGYQYAFFAPIYLDSVKDIPYQFIIELTFSNSRYSVNKELRINIGKDSNKNYIYKYITNYVDGIDTNVIYMNNLDKTVTYYGIDLLNGGFSKKTDSNLSSLFNIQLPIQMFDQSIMNGFAKNIICMKQILPLAYMFNTEDVLTEEEKTKFKYCDIKISGYYTNVNGEKIDFYDFDFDYDLHNENIISMNPNTGALSYYSGYVSNIMNVGFPSFNDKYLATWMFSNKTNAEYCRWKMKYSSDEYPYITNMSWAFSKNQNSNYKYKEFPTSFLPQAGYAKVNDDLKYDLIFPFSEDKQYYDHINTRSAIKYKNIMNNYCLNWFDVLKENKIDINNINWSDVDNGYTYFNSVLYNLNALYNKIPNTSKKIDKFAFLVYPDTTDINNSENIQNKIKFATYTIDTTKANNCSLIEANSDGTYDSLYNINGQYNASISGLTTYEEAEENYSGELFVDSKDLGINYYQTNLLFRRCDIPEIEALSTIASIKSIDDLKNIFKLIFDDEYFNSIDDKIFNEIFNYLISDSFNEENLPNIFRNILGYDSYERIPLYKGNSYMNDNQSIQDTLGKYLTDEPNKKSANLYYTTNDDVTLFKKISKDSQIDDKYEEVIYGITLYNKDYFIDKYYFDPERNKNNYSVGNNIFSTDVLNFIKDIVVYIYNNFNNITSGKQHYAYNPIYSYNGQIVMENVITKTYDHFGKSFDDRVIDSKIDDNVLYVHPHNIEKILETVDSTIDINSLDSSILYAKVLDVEHLKALLKYKKLDNDNTYYKFYKQYKIVVQSETSGFLDVKMKYELIDFDLTDAIESNKLQCDSTNGLFYLNDDDKNKFTIVEYNKFIKINSKIWEKININSSDEYFDMFIYRPMVDTEYDQKFAIANPIIFVDPGTEINNTDTIIVESLDSMLYPCFNSAFVQDKQQTLFFKNYSLNNISAVKLINKETNEEIETYYRYNCDNSTLFMLITDKSLLPAGVKIYKNAFANSAVDYLIQENTDPEFAKYKLNVITINGVTYGYYILQVKMNNTSAMFNVRGFLDSSPNNKEYNIDQINLIKYITVINGIDITEKENTTYICDIFKQICPFLFINLLPFMSQLETVMSPNTFSLTSVYSSLHNSNSEADERILKYNKQTIISAKKQILQRYTDAITPYIKKTSTVTNQYMLKYKNVNKTLLDTGNYPSLGDYSMMPFDINIYTYRGSNIYGYSDNLENSYNTPIGEYEKYEYKHYDCSKMINLEKYFEIQLNDVLSYSQLLEKESETESINIFSKYISRFINAEDDKILFLFKKYKVNYDTSVVSTTLDGSEKTYKLKYKFTLL